MSKRDPLAAGEAGVQKDPPSATEFSAFVYEDAADDRILKSSMWVAVGVHALLLAINFPALGNRPIAEEPEKPEVFRVTQVRPRPPEVPRQPLRREKIRRVPVPDLTPHGPEPLPVDDRRTAIDLPDPDVDSFPIPEAPPAPPEPAGPIQVGGEVARPERIHSPQPRYTELARRTRTQGTVVVEAIIDRRGEVTNVKVLKGLPMGLTEEAVKTIRQWKFEPATLRGKPVDVYYTLTVRFQLN